MQDGFRPGFMYTCDTILTLHCVGGKGEKGYVGVCVGMKGWGDGGAVRWCMVLVSFRSRWVG